MSFHYTAEDLLDQLTRYWMNKEDLEIPVMLGTAGLPLRFYGLDPKEGVLLDIGLFQTAYNLLDALRTIYFEDRDLLDCPVRIRGTAQNLCIHDFKRGSCIILGVCHEN